MWQGLSTLHLADRSPRRGGRAGWAGTLCTEPAYGPALGTAQGDTCFCFQRGSPPTGVSQGHRRCQPGPWGGGRPQGSDGKDLVLCTAAQAQAHLTHMSLPAAHVTHDEPDKERLGACLRSQSRSVAELGQQPS